MEDMKEYCTFYVVRHAESEHNLNEIMQGHTDTPLTQTGKQQAKNFTGSFKHIKFDAVFSSDLMRAYQTAEIIAAEKNLTVNTTKLLRERFFGVYEGQPIKKYLQETRHQRELLKSMAEAERQNFKSAEGFESNAEIAGRMLRFLRETALAYLGKIVLVASHGSIMRAFLMKTGVVTYDQLLAEDMEHLSYIKLKSDGVDFFVQDLQGINTSKFSFKPQA